MARKLTSDKVLFVTLVALSLFGCVMIYSASAVSAGETSGNPYRYLVKQIAALVLGGIAAFIVYRTDYRRLRASPGWSTARTARRSRSRCSRSSARRSTARGGGFPSA